MTFWPLVVFKKYWRLLASVLMLVVGVVLLLHTGYGIGERASDLKWSKKDAAWAKKWAERDAADARAKAAEEARQRNKEQQRQIAAMEEGKKANEELAKAKANADDAKRVGYSLQQQLDRLQKRYNAERATSSLSTAAAVSQAKSETIVLLTQLYRESDKAAGEYAEEADRNYVNGRSCERTYERVTQQ